jgi:hypothetical protein
MESAKVFLVVSVSAALTVACGSNSGDNGAQDSGATTDDTGAGTGMDTGSAGDGSTGGDDGSMSAVMIMCSDKSSCMGGQICCATAMIGGSAGFSVKVACAAQCGTGMFDYQVCTTDGECVKSGTSCQPIPGGAAAGKVCLPMMIPVSDAGGDASGDGGAPRDAGTTDTGPRDSGLADAPAG